MQPISGELNLCTKCIGSASFSEWIERNGSNGQCDFDSSHGSSLRVMTVQEFAREVDRYFRSHYQLGAEYQDFSNEFDNPSYEQFGDPYENILANDLDCSETV